MSRSCRIELVDRARSFFIEASEGALVADVLRDSGYSLEFDCGGRGVCGRCAVGIAMAAEEGASSPRLACQTRVVPGMRVDVSALARLDERRPERLAAPAERGVVDDAGASDSERGGALGLAIDLGTTTLAVALVSLETGRAVATKTRRNSQTAFGRDVISRISAASEGGAATMRRLVCADLGAIAEELVEEFGATSAQIEEVVVAGNTTMEFLFSGRDVAPLGVAPFAVGSRVFAETRVEDYPWRLMTSRNARVRVFPVFSAFVGGDILAGFEYLKRRGEFDDAGTRLFLDVGTNGESILAANGRFYATSTAAGPAFEGSEISQGSLAVPGAIAAIDYDPAALSWRPRTIDETPASSICGSGLVDAIAGALDFGVLASSGRLAAPDAPALPDAFRDRLRVDGRRRALLVSDPAELTATRGVWLEQKDVRQAQLAICAMKTGLRLMLSSAKVAASELDTLLLAGSFGASLNVEHARRVGMFPSEIPADRVRFCGNTSLLGAIDALAGRVDWSEAEKDAELVEHVDLAGRPEFNDVFADCGRFPE